MKSRYVAFKLSNAKYIINTTHKENKDFQEDFSIWNKQILEFSKNCDFNHLKILEFIDGEKEAYVAFKVEIICNKEDNSFVEKSKFLKEDDKWFYHSGIINLI